MKLGLDNEKIGRARESARIITGQVQDFINGHTTTAIERTVLRLYGVNGVDRDDAPLPNAVIDNIQDGGGLSRGASFWLCSAMVRHDLTAQEVAEAVGTGDLDLTREPLADEGAIRETVDGLARRAVDLISGRRRERDEWLRRLREPQLPYLYVIVATGNIHEDVVQAQAAARQGADIIAVIRSTGQSLLDYVPYGATTEGYGGTYATQENFRIMRQALDEVSEELGRYVRLVNYCSGLCMPEIAAMGAMERLDLMLNDAMYGILFRDINMKRTFVDQFFSRMINGFAGIIINTGEDNYLTTDDAFEAAHTVLASQFINEQFALRSGIPVEQMGLGHAFQMNPDLEDSLLYEIAQAQMAREIFPGAPLKYMPPTKYMTGNIFKGHVMNAMFNLASVATGQTIHLLGMLTEAIHTPYLHDRYLAIENARYVMHAASHLSEEIEFKPGGRIQTRAREVLDRATDLLAEVERMGLMTALEKGLFARVKRSPDGGKGRDGVAAKAPDYFNPFPDLILKC